MSFVINSLVKGVGVGDSLFRLVEEGSFTDVTLRSAQGREFACHRCVLVCRSDYFRCLFSSGLRESREGIVTMSNVSSSTLSLLLEFVYTSKCRFRFDDFVDLFIAADMIQMKEFLDLLLDEFEKKIKDASEEKPKVVGGRRVKIPRYDSYVNHQDDDDEDSANGGDNEDYADDLKKLVFDVWVFCQEYPCLGRPLSGKTRRSLREMVNGALLLLKKSRHALLVAQLNTDEFWSFLSDLERHAGDQFNDHLFHWISTWISASYHARVKYLERFLHHVHRIDRVSDDAIRVCWTLSGLAYDIPRVLELKRSMSRPLLVLPYRRGADTQFLVHDLRSFETFSILPPQLDPGFHRLGRPQLTATGDGELFCVQAARKDVVDDALFYCAHRFFMKKWEIVSPYRRYERSTVQRWSYHNDFAYRKIHEESSLTIIGFTIPAFLPERSPGFRFIPIVQRSYVGLSNEGDGGNANARVEMHFVEGLYLNGDRCSDRTESHGDAIKDSFKIMAPKRELQLVGAGVFEGKRKCPVAFGNLFDDDGQLVKSLILSEHSSFQSRTKPMPNGLQFVPLSIANVEDYTFCLESGPHFCGTSSSSSISSSRISLPRLTVVKVTEDPSFQEIPTPSLPDIDYASMYYDWTERKICLVLVQKPRSRQFLSAAVVSATRSSKDGRLVGFFKTRMDGLELAAQASRYSLRSYGEVWESLPVSEATADFLSLGCFLPGEVRLTPAILDGFHLRPVSLLSRRHEDDCVVVDFDDVGVGAVSSNGADDDDDDDRVADANGSNRNGPRWTAWQRSSSFGETQVSLEPTLNLFLKERPIVWNCVDVRQTRDRQFQFQLPGLPE